MYLKEIEQKDLEVFTPTRWQTVILRNYGLVPTSNIAKVLGRSEELVEKEAKRLKIDFIEYNELWLKKSYLTIIRNNWHLLSYNQLLVLTGLSKEFLDNELKNNDFLWVKLGGYKPKCSEVKYYPLNIKEAEQTELYAHTIERYAIKDYAKPFDFKTIELSSGNNEHLMIAYPYSLSCGDIFLIGDEIVADEELHNIKASGINALWLNGELNKLSPNKFCKTNDNEYLLRRENLNRFINRASDQGIKIFLYFNEPRSLVVSEIKDEYRYLIGRIENSEASLCFSHKEVQDNLKEMVKSLLSDVPSLGGIITITMSENLTHCKHKLGSDCETCKDIPSYETAAKINNVIQSAIDEVNSSAILIANLWGWMPYCDMPVEDAIKGIQLLDKKINVLCVSEFGTHNGFNIEEYSIAFGTPSKETKIYLKAAKESGHNVIAKVQVNNSWELATVPYIPVFERIMENIEELKDLGVNDYMLSWTLGGYPSINMNLISSMKSDFDYKEWLNNNFKNPDIIQKITGNLSKLIKLYPYCQKLLYFSPIQLGSLNLIYLARTDLKATMVTFPFDDIESWFDEITLDKVNQLRRTVNKELKKIDDLSKLANLTNIEQEIVRNAKVLCLNLGAALNQYTFYKNRDDKCTRINCLKDELKCTLELYKIASEDVKIGFEASNQYMFTQNSFLEKLVNLKHLMISCSGD